MTNKPSINPSFPGQRLIAECPITGKKCKRQAKYREGVLLWWCFCDSKVPYPRQIIEKK